MNKILELYNNIPDDELKLIIKEMVEDEPKGYVSDGYVRKYVNKTRQITNSTSFSSDLLMVQMALYKQAAQRWIQ